DQEMRCRESMVEVFAGVGAIARTPVGRAYGEAERLLEIPRARVAEAIHERARASLAVAVHLRNRAVQIFRTKKKGQTTREPVSASCAQESVEIVGADKPVAIHVLEQFRVVRRKFDPRRHALTTKAGPGSA